MNKPELDRIYIQIKDNSKHDGFVWGAGDINAKIMLIGEAPGKEEIKSGIPFSGAAGANLTEFLDILKLPRDKIFITNVCKFRSTKTSAKGTVANRTPTRAEVKEAAPYLYMEIKTVEPKIIVTLGNTALSAVCGNTRLKIGEAHGKLLNAEIDGKEYSLFPLYHPASVIYNQSLKKIYYEDLEKLKKVITKIG